MGKIGFGFLGEPDINEMARLSRLAEDAGFESIWISETRFKRDAITAATAVLLNTTRIRVGTAAINVYTRGAVLSAVTFATLDEFSNGRLVLGIGPGSSEILEAQGYAYDRPLSRLREFIPAMKSVWLGEPYEGAFERINGVALDFTPARSSIPIYLAVSGPRALTYAGEAADGVVLDSFTPTSQIRRAAERVRAAAVASGRDPAAVEIGGALNVALDTPEQSGRELVAPLVAIYLTLFPTIARDSGLSEPEIAEMQRIAESEGTEALSRQLPDDVIDSLTVSGSVEHCRARINEYRDAGLDLPILFATPEQMEQVIATLAGA